MKLTIELADTAELEKVMTLFSTLRLENVRVISPTIAPTIRKGNKKLNAKELFGIWKAQPRNLEDLRAKNWQRDWNV